MNFVKRVYFKNWEGKIQRAIVDQYNFIFYPGCGGWSPLGNLKYKIVELPGLIEFDGFWKDWHEHFQHWVYFKI